MTPRDPCWAHHAIGRTMPYRINGPAGWCYNSNKGSDARCQESAANPVGVGRPTTTCRELASVCRRVEPRGPRVDWRVPRPVAHRMAHLIYHRNESHDASIARGCGCRSGFADNSAVVVSARRSYRSRFLHGLRSVRCGLPRKLYRALPLRTRRLFALRVPRDGGTLFGMPPVYPLAETT